ncbi:putative quinol monooxygenase [Mesobacterium pallidum]|uniref:putative quinol monooxygenase n=1 Tax=Mesobacterium pallidum TaxID=2872037 RepID=UPI001EE32ACE|nr:putative quinol monooxygenase [Mesobacterium pallidum]
MIFVAMQIRARPGASDRLAAAMTVMMSATREEAGCVSYTYSRDLTDPDLFHLCEIWQSRPEMVAHIEQPHSAVFVETLEVTGTFESVRAYEGEVAKIRIPAPGQAGA